MKTGVENFHQVVLHSFPYLDKNLFPYYLLSYNWFHFGMSFN